MKAATSASPRRRTATPAPSAAAPSAAASAAPQATKAATQAMNLMPQWQAPMAEPWLEFTRGYMELWSSWSQASTQMQMEAWRALGLQMPNNLAAPSADQLAALWSWAQPGGEPAARRSTAKRG